MSLEPRTTLSRTRLVEILGAAALQPTRTLTSDHVAQVSNGVKLDANPRRP